MNKNYYYAKKTINLLLIILEFEKKENYIIVNTKN